MTIIIILIFEQVKLSGLSAALNSFEEVAVNTHFTQQYFWINMERNLKKFLFVALMQQMSLVENVLLVKK